MPASAPGASSSASALSTARLVDWGLRDGQCGDDSYSGMYPYGERRDDLSDRSRSLVESETETECVLASWRQYSARHGLDGSGTGSCSGTGTCSKTSKRRGARDSRAGSSSTVTRRGMVRKPRASEREVSLHNFFA